MGTISALFGFGAGLINQGQFSVLVAGVVASAILPTILAQRVFHPRQVFEAMGSETDPELLEAESRPP